MKILNNFFGSTSENTKEKPKRPKLKSYEQHFEVHITGILKPFKCSMTRMDIEIDGWLYLIDINEHRVKWLEARPQRGIIIGDVWYSPAVIEKIVFAELVVKEIE